MKFLTGMLISLFSLFVHAELPNYCPDSEYHPPRQNCAKCLGQPENFVELRKSIGDVNSILQQVDIQINPISLDDFKNRLQKRAFLSLKEQRERVLKQVPYSPTPIKLLRCLNHSPTLGRYTQDFQEHKVTTPRVINYPEQLQVALQVKLILEERAKIEAQFQQDKKALEQKIIHRKGSRKERQKYLLKHKVTKEYEQQQKRINMMLSRMVAKAPLFLEPFNDNSIFDWANYKVRPTALFNQLSKSIPPSLMSRYRAEVTAQAKSIALDTPNNFGNQTIEKSAEFMQLLEHYRTDEKLVRLRKRAQHDYISSLNDSMLKICENNGEGLHHFSKYVETVLEDDFGCHASGDQPQSCIWARKTHCVLLSKEPQTEESAWAMAVGGGAVIAGAVLQFIPVAGQLIGTPIATAGGLVIAQQHVASYMRTSKELDNAMALHNIGKEEFKKVLALKNKKGDLQGDLALDSLIFLDFMQMKTLASTQTGKRVAKSSVKFKRVSVKRPSKVIKSVSTTFSKPVGPSVGTVRKVTKAQALLKRTKYTKAFKVYKMDDFYKFKRGLMNNNTNALLRIEHKYDPRVKYLRGDGIFLDINKRELFSIEDTGTTIEARKAALRARDAGVVQKSTEEKVFYRWMDKERADDAIQTGQFTKKEHERIAHRILYRDKEAAGHGIYVSENPYSSSNYGGRAGGGIVEVRVKEGYPMIDLVDNEINKKAVKAGVTYDNILIENSDYGAIKYRGGKTNWWVLKEHKGVTYHKFTGSKLSFDELNSAVEQMAKPQRKVFSKSIERSVKMRIKKDPKLISHPVVFHVLDKRDIVHSIQDAPTSALPEFLDNLGQSFMPTKDVKSILRSLQDRAKQDKEVKKVLAHYFKSDNKFFTPRENTYRLRRSYQEKSADRSTLKVFVREFTK